MSPIAIPAAKQAVRAADVAGARRLAGEALEQDSAAAVRRLLAAALSSGTVHGGAPGRVGR